MTKEELIRVLVLLSQIEGFARANIQGKYLPDDMFEEMEYVISLLAEKIKE